MSDQLPTRQLADAIQQGENDFIDRLLSKLGERTKLPVGDWDCEDDPAEFIANQIAFLTHEIARLESELLKKNIKRIPRGAGRCKRCGCPIRLNSHFCGPCAEEGAC